MSINLANRVEERGDTLRKISIYWVLLVSIFVDLSTSEAASDKKPDFSRASSEVAASTEYRSMISGFGKLSGSFFQLLAISQKCPQKYLDLRTSFEVAFKDYKNRNKFLDAAKNNLYKRAKKEGGSAEVLRLQTEMSEGMGTQMERVERFAAGLSRKQCRSYLSMMVKGDLDFKKTSPNEVELLIGN